MMVFRLLPPFVFFIFWGCNADFYSLPARVQPGIVNMVVEIPAGTTLKTEYNPATRKFKAARVNGVPRKVQYHPYPGNYGFIPSTAQSKEKGGDGDALDILLQADAIPRERVIQVIPIAVLRLKDGGENDSKIIAVPVNKNLRTVNCTQFVCLKENYPSVLTILETWFANYKGASLKTLLLFPSGGDKSRRDKGEEDKKFGFLEMPKGQTEVHVIGWGNETEADQEVSICSTQ